MISYSCSVISFEVSFKSLANRWDGWKCTGGYLGTARTPWKNMGSSSVRGWIPTIDTIFRWTSASPVSRDELSHTHRAACSAMESLAIASIKHGTGKHAFFLMGTFHPEMGRRLTLWCHQTWPFLARTSTTSRVWWENHRTIAGFASTPCLNTKEYYTHTHIHPNDGPQKGELWRNPSIALRTIQAPTFKEKRSTLQFFWCSKNLIRDEALQGPPNLISQHSWRTEALVLVND